MAEFKNFADHPQEVAKGRVLAPGETITDKDFDPSNEYNKDLMERGILVDVGKMNTDGVKWQKDQDKKLKDDEEDQEGGS